jgi:hypothetical protein
MFPPDDLWLTDETFADESVDLLTVPQIKRHVAHDLDDEELGLRSLHERPSLMPRSLWDDEKPRAKRSPHDRRAARPEPSSPRTSASSGAIARPYARPFRRLR